MLCFNKDLLKTVLVLVKLVIDLIEIVQGNSVGHHLQRFQFARLDLLHEILPILVYRSLAVTDEANTTLHQ